MHALFKFAPIAGLLFRNPAISELNEPELQSIANCFGPEMAPTAMTALESIYAAAQPEAKVNDVINHPLIQNLMKGFNELQQKRASEGEPVFCTCPGCNLSFETAI